tara:strand:+ start:135 stop:407 length:273 start_codon:yes stop_codon:yes gene_type:complete
MKTNIKNINTDTPAYKKMANSEHTFKPKKLYSFADIARLTGVSAMGIRQRAIYDQWPTISIFVAKGQTKRPHFVSGSFLKSLQKKAKQTH